MDPSGSTTIKNLRWALEFDMNNRSTPQTEHEKKSPSPSTISKDWKTLMKDEYTFRSEICAISLWSGSTMKNRFNGYEGPRKSEDDKLHKKQEDIAIPNFHTAVQFSPERIENLPNFKYRTDRIFFEKINSFSPRI